MILLLNIDSPTVWRFDLKRFQSRSCTVRAQLNRDQWQCFRSGCERKGGGVGGSRRVLRTSLANVSESVQSLVHRCGRDDAIRRRPVRNTVQYTRMCCSAREVEVHGRDGRETGRGGRGRQARGVPGAPGTGRRPAAVHGYSRPPPSPASATVAAAAATAAAAAAGAARVADARARRGRWQDGRRGRRPGDRLPQRPGHRARGRHAGARDHAGRSHGTGAPVVPGQRHDHHRRTAAQPAHVRAATTCHVPAVVADCQPRDDPMAPPAAAVPRVQHALQSFFRGKSTGFVFSLFHRFRQHVPPTTHTFFWAFTGLYHPPP